VGIILNNDSNIYLNDFLKKKEILYLLEVFGLSVLLFVAVGNVFTTSDDTVSYFLSLISSALIINGYNKIKNGNKQ
jgi:hypothetical protein